MPVRSTSNASNSTLAHSRHDLFKVGTFSTTDAREGLGGPTLASSHPDSFEAHARSVNSTKLPIEIPATSTNRGSGQVTEDESDTHKEIANGRRTFCPLEHRDAV